MKKSLLAKISDRFLRLNLAVKKGFIEEAGKIVANLLVDSRSCFFFREARQFRICTRMVGYTENDRGLGQILVVFHRSVDALTPCKYQQSFVEEVALDFAWLVNFLEWGDKEVENFVRNILSATAMKIFQNERDSPGVLVATSEVARHFIPQDDPLRKRVELWLLLSTFREGLFVEMQRLSFGDPVNLFKNGEVLKKASERMLELGMTKAEVKKEFLDWIVKKREGFDLRDWPQQLVAVAGSNVFSQGDADLSAVLRKEYLYDFWSRLKNGDLSWDLFEKLGRLGLWDPSEDRRSFFSSELADLLSEGKLTLVEKLLSRFGLSFGLGDNLGDVLVSLSGVAFVQAFCADRFGVAFAIAEHFGIEDQCVEDARVLAFELGQAVRFR